ncbi:pyridoxamine 5'-phosphate oxidase family protein [Mucilaginibacter rubeus]|uniref:Pyridoxamine 5'-phosphate oxidase family protein n=1 Tax=Mucilaginibacter rubeus TaxID=2027860 RepID=A0AAE6MIP8_9SPHI|nr:MULTISPECIES: pyridoxamine 5'-phosphate oxidase family protein [Mucilaginibacter]QEM04372.1 pyridoxamine 5'-phosphate oxidase family protein [Mucilaginibacter rubeus]QEM16970.1 pyridoxamine 5'-phosphate oxidase family protein [Mucilaginibacter gossypii]QTE46537.1 pyridoxamine 5'-phosphate oxidase family protein [Mucilaginibacter rubeus]QTE53134.1 pyridoxamine 5'-phosphate oxidase family protein [Mucilaginibacter rubeus]QTE58221.1 pyridoxamine 5'-phosphate oxidase family protein [Mucilaginib
MGKFFNEILDHHKDFIAHQKIFFVATAPLSSGGYVNLSPKDNASFCILSNNRVAYMDIIGSGNETAAHLLENQRITFMFCAFDGPPNILRLYGKGHSILPNGSNAVWNELSSYFNIHMATRQIIVGDIDLVQTSCGFSVPLYEYSGERDYAIKWAEKKGEQGLANYKQEKNRVSLDGLPTPLY